MFAIASTSVLWVVGPVFGVDAPAGAASSPASKIYHKCGKSVASAVFRGRL